jgi:aminoglycoside phosphotransferase
VLEGWDASALIGSENASAAPINPQAMLEGLARRLETAHEANPADAALGRELRATLVVLRGPNGAGDDDRSRFWAEFSGA